LSGDVIDKESKSYESLGPLQDGLRKLNNAGIDTVAIAGNHDHDVLPRVAGAVGTDRFRLLGKGGVWERHTIERNGEPSLHVCGWSFPREHVRDNPTLTISDYPDDGIPVLGMLHADVGNTQSQYAPIAIDDLWTRPVDFWLLGHVHGYRQFSGPGGILAMYPGSSFAMDPGEAGAHGVWIIELERGHLVAPRLVAISPVRYETLTVDLGGVTDEGEFQSVIVSALRSAGQTALTEFSERHLSVVAIRLKLVGRCAAHSAVAGWVDRVRDEIGDFPVGSVVLHIDEVTSEVRPPVELELLARVNDPVGETARLLIALDVPSLTPPYSDLVHRTARDLETIQKHAGYANLMATEQVEMVDQSTETAARKLLINEGWRLLSALLAQREAI
jgi:exonuclease SbcD